MNIEDVDFEYLTCEAKKQLNEDNTIFNNGLLFSICRKYLEKKDLSVDLVDEEFELIVEMREILRSLI